MTTEEIHAMYNHSGVDVTSAGCEGCLEAAHLHNRGKAKRCYSTVTPSDDTIAVKHICQSAGESQFSMYILPYRNNSQTLKKNVFFNIFTLYLQEKEQWK